VNSIDRRDFIVTANGESFYVQVEVRSISFNKKRSTLFWDVTQRRLVVIY